MLQIFKDCDCFQDYLSQPLTINEVHGCLFFQTFKAYVHMYVLTNMLIVAALLASRDSVFKGIGERIEIV